jgi:hydroxymethylglutaryl-CoA lyase
LRELNEKTHPKLNFMHLNFKTLLLFIIFLNSQLFSAFRLLELGLETRRLARCVSTLAASVPSISPMRESVHDAFKARSTPFNLPPCIDISWSTARDGLQIYHNTPFKISHRGMLLFLETGITQQCFRQEVGSFVNPSRLPAVSQPHLVIQKMIEYGIPPQAQRVSVLVTNERGFEDFAKLFDKVPEEWKRVLEPAIFTAACPVFLKRNTGFSCIEDHMKILEKIAIEAAALHVYYTRAFVSMAFRSPFNNDNLTTIAANLCKGLHKMGYAEIVPADTNGLASVTQIIDLFSDLQKCGIPKESLGFHGHDLGNEIEALVAALPFVNTVDVTVSGIGGCPFSPGAPGNMNARLVANVLEALGVKTGVSYPHLKKAEIALSGMLKRYGL